MMNKRHLLLALLLLLLSGQNSMVSAESAISGGARYHQNSSVIPDWAFDEGDLSYQVGYEYKEGAGYWQLLVGFAPDVTDDGLEETPEIKTVITPQLNLIFEDQGWLAGTGILGNYIETEEDSDWSDLYFQLMIGFNLPLPFLSPEFMAVYPFEDWGDLGDFDFDDIEYSLLIKYEF